MRIVGVNIPDNKKVEIALTYIYGLGRAAAQIVARNAKVNPVKKAGELTAEEINKIRGAIEKNYKIEGELKQIVKQNINRLKSISCYRGTRHAKRLPVRGQRTRTNSRTVRGNVRKTMGSGKRKVELR